MIPIKLIVQDELIAEFDLEKIEAIPETGDTIQVKMSNQHDVYIGWTSWKVDDTRVFMDVDLGNVTQVHLYVSPASNADPKV